MDDNELRQRPNLFLDYVSKKETYIALALAAFMLVIDITNPRNDTIKILLSFFGQYVPILVVYVLVKLGNQKLTNKSFESLAVIGTAILFALYITFYLYETLVLAIVLASYAFGFHIIILPTWLNIWPISGKTIIIPGKKVSSISG